MTAAVGLVFDMPIFRATPGLVAKRFRLTVHDRSRRLILVHAQAVTPLVGIEACPEYALQCRFHATSFLYLFI